MTAWRPTGGFAECKMGVGWIPLFIRSRRLGFVHIGIAWRGAVSSSSVVEMQIHGTIQHETIPWRSLDTLGTA
jgi:hypothetical protein